VAADDGRGLSLLQIVEFQAAQCEVAGSPLYAHLLRGIAADVERGGVTKALLEEGSGPDPFATVVALRLLAAVHRVVLEGRAPALAAHYPSAGGRAGRADDDVVATLLATVAEHLDELRVHIHDGLQTNEVGRCATLVVGYAHVLRTLGLPLRILEVGTSAGLNLRWDRFAYDTGDGVAGDPSSPVRFRGCWSGRPLDLSVPFTVAERRGGDRNPLDPSDPDHVLRLRSAIWPDMTERRARLDGALAAAVEVPVVVDRADAVDWVATQLAEPRPGVATVVTHSIVLQYLDPPARERFVAAVTEAGARATADAPLAWVRMEPGGERASLRCTVWPAGDDRLLARSGYHGIPVEVQ
jgi:hypothetical protein